MSQPTPYSRGYSFSSFQTQNPTTPLPANKLDVELNSISLTLAQVLANIALIQRDDGNIANNTIGTSQMDAALISLGFSRPTTWATSTVYAVNSAVFQSNGLYVCLVAHTSGTFATDLAALEWTLVADLSSVLTGVAASAASALSSSSAASASAASATASFLAMDKKWLGNKSGDPAVDNQGAALVAGAGYYNTTNNQLKVYSGAVWFVVAGPSTGYLVNANNLSDITTPATALANIGGAALVGGNTITGNQTLTGNLTITGNITASGTVGSVPSGTVLEYYGTTEPSGFFFANGQAVSRATYAALFAALGVTYGVGDGSTTFNVPDKRGRIGVGNDSMGIVGAANLVQATTNLTTTSGTTAATVASATGLVKGMTIVSANVVAGTTITAITGTAVTLSANATASSTVSSRFSIFTDAQVLGSKGGEAAHQLTTVELAAHTHGGALISNSSGGGQGNVWQANGNALNTGSAGNDQVHNNIQPAIVCNFIIKT